MTNRRRLLAALTAAGALVLGGQQAATAAGPAPTTTTVSVDSAQITAIIGGQLPIASPSGTITFYVDGHKVGSKTVQATATDTVTAVLKYHVKTGKTRHIKVSYGGDMLYAPSSKTIVRADPTVRYKLKSSKPKSKYGWYRRPVQAVFSCVAHGSPIECPTPLRFDHNGAGQKGTQTVTAGNGGSVTIRIRHINIDMQRPTLTVTGTGSQAKCHAHDRISGVASCTIRHSNGHYRAVAIDRAGNRRVVSVRS